MWAIRVRLQVSHHVRDLALFNLAIDSKLRSCDLLDLKVGDVCREDRVASRAIVMQRKTGRPVQFEMTDQTRTSVTALITQRSLKSADFLFSGRKVGHHLSTRQYSRIVRRWAAAAGLESESYGTHSLRRTKACLIYRTTKNIRACNCSSATRSLRAPSDIWASSWKMPWRSRRSLLRNETCALRRRALYLQGRFGTSNA